MTNREKLFKKLEEMDNETLSDVIDLPCAECPAYGYCCGHTLGEASTCQGAMRMWLDEG